MNKKTAQILGISIATIVFIFCIIYISENLAKDLEIIEGEEENDVEWEEVIIKANEREVIQRSVKVRGGITNTKITIFESKENLLSQIPSKIKESKNYELRLKKLEDTIDNLYIDIKKNKLHNSELTASGDIHIGDVVHKYESEAKIIKNSKA